MKNVLSLAAGLAAAASFASHAAAQNCYDPYMQCWSFAPRGSEIERLDTGVSLRSKQLSITGDLRLRIRGGTAPNDAPYPGGGEADQQATRGRIQMNFQATEKVRAKVEFLFAETWAGSESYSDALGGTANAPNEQYNKISMAYVASKDLLGLGEELVLRLGERDATFEIGTTRLTTRLIEGEFPNYRQLIPASHPNVLTVEREPLLEAIRRVKILARDATPVRLRISADGLQLTAITQDVGNATEELDASASGSDLTVAFNPDYLAAGVEAVGSEQITLSTLDALKPAVVRGVGSDDYLYLLMPVRVP